MNSVNILSYTPLLIDGIPAAAAAAAASILKGR
jgi:hypothetical protein